MTIPLPIAVLISGGGTTLRNLIMHRNNHALPIDIRLVVSSSAKARGLQFATDANIPTKVIASKPSEGAQSFSDQYFNAIRDSEAKIVVMGGFLKHLLIPTDFENRVINIHPSLIPAFCGFGMYGHHVHQSVLDFGAKISGCTVHFVDNQFDHGPIIAQQAVAVEDNDSAESLAGRIFEAECELYPKVLRWLAADRVRVVDGRTICLS